MSVLDTYEPAEKPVEQPVEVKTVEDVKEPIFEAIAKTGGSVKLENGCVEIKEFDVPTITEFPKDAIEKIEHMARVLELPSIISPQKLYDEARRAVEVANKYRDQYRAWRKGMAHFRVETPSGIVKVEWHDRLATDAKLGRTIAVRGPAGNGKSTGVRVTLESMGYNIYHLDCTDSTTAEQLIGGLYPEGDGKGGINMVFRDGVFTKAFQDPKGAIQLDEFDALDPRVAMTLQSALHRATKGKNRFVSSPDHEKGGTYAVGDCPVIVTMNTWGNGATREYVGRNAIDAASMDRFDTVIDTTYTHEKKIIKAGGYSTATADWVVDKAIEIRKKIENKNLRIVLSTRRVLDIAESVEKLGLDFEEAFSRDFVERLEQMDRDALDLKLAVKK